MADKPGDDKSKALALAQEAAQRFLVLQMSPTDVQEIIRGALGAEGVSPNDLERVKIPTGGATSWTVNTVDGEQELKTLKGVIIAHRQVRAYWPGEYTGERTPPQCYSDDAVQGHGDPGVECARCPWSQWESAAKGRGQACKLIRLVFFLPEESFLPFVIPLPPTSERIGKQYITGLASVGLLPWHVLTEVGLERTKNEGGIQYSKAAFKRIATFDVETRKRMTAFAEELRPAILRVRVDAADYDGSTDATDAVGREMPDTSQGAEAEVAI